MGTGRLGCAVAGAPRRPAAAGLTVNSSRVFQARQCGHCPAQRSDSPPHSRQTKVVVVLGMVGGWVPTLAAPQKIYKRRVNLFGLLGRY